MLNNAIQAYNEAIMDTDRIRALEVVHSALDEGISPEDVVFKVVVPAIEQMMKAVTEKLGASLAQHFMAAQIASEVVDEMIPRFGSAPASMGRIVLGNAQGDFHGLGKRIITGCLKAFMVEVVDLGLSVSPQKFVDEALANNAHVIGISAMMVHTARSENGPLAVRKILRERKLEKQIKIVVGGAPFRFDHALYEVVGADAWAQDGISAGKVIADLIRETKK